MLESHEYINAKASFRLNSPLVLKYKLYYRMAKSLAPATPMTQGSTL
jgi:hypothetical protein